MPSFAAEFGLYHERWFNVKALRRKQRRVEKNFRRNAMTLISREDSAVKKHVSSLNHVCVLTIHNRQATIPEKRRNRNDCYPVLSSLTK
jgi:hypothetical protein